VANRCRRRFRTLSLTPAAHQPLKTHFSFETKARGVATAGLQIRPSMSPIKIPKRLHHRACVPSHSGFLNKRMVFVVKACAPVTRTTMTCIGISHSRLQAIAQTLAAISMARQLQTPAMRLVDDGLVFLQRERWNVDHFFHRE